jgi:hypothetical protein
LIATLELTVWRQVYEIGIITDNEDSPHLLLDKIKGELYYTFAETDQAVRATYRAN